MMNAMFNFTGQLNEAMFIPPKEYTNSNEYTYKGEGKNILCLKHITTIRSSETIDASKEKIIDFVYFHGNSENISTCWERVNRIADFIMNAMLDLYPELFLTVRILVPEYPGYINQDVKTLTVKIIDTWCQDIANEVYKMQGSLKRIVLLWGYSLGSGFATKVLKYLEQMVYANTSIPYACLVLEAPFYSVKHVVKASVGFFEKLACKWFWDDAEYEYFPVGRLLVEMVLGNPDWKKLVFCAENDIVCGQSIEQFDQLFGTFGAMDHMEVFLGWTHDSFAKSEETKVVFESVWKFGIQKILDEGFKEEEGEGEKEEMKGKEEEEEEEKDKIYGELDELFLLN